MTRLRKLAVKISDTVVRRAPPAYRDWASATARELEFIESDWAALRWALGSWKMAATCQMHTPFTSMAEVPRAAQRFLREARVGAIITPLTLLWMCYWFSGVFRNPVAGRQNWLGWGLILAILGYIACEAITFRGWRFPREAGLPEVANAYRSVLLHQRDLISGVWLWSRITLIVAGPVLATYHAWLLKPSPAHQAFLRANLLACGVMLLTVIVTRPATRSVVARYQRTIDQLDALESRGR